MHLDFHKLFAPPVFPEDEDKSRSAAILNTIGWSSLLMVLGILFVRIIQADDVNLTEVNSILAATSIVIVALLYLSHRGYVKTASLIFVMTLWSALSYIAWAADGIRDIAFFCVHSPDPGRRSINWLAGRSHPDIGKYSFRLGTRVRASDSIVYPYPGHTLELCAGYDSCPPLDLYLDLFDDHWSSKDSRKITIRGTRTLFFRPGAK